MTFPTPQAPEYQHEAITDPERISVLLPVIRAYFAELPELHKLTLDEDGALEAIRLHLKHAMGRVLVSKTAGSIIGLAFLTYDDTSTKEIVAVVHSVYVLDAHRKGPAPRQLMDAVEAAAKADGAVRIVAECPDLISGTGQTFKNLLARRGYRFYSRGIKEL